MGIFSDILGTSDTEATDWTPCTGSPYSPLKSGRLIQVRLLFSQTTAASVLSLAHVKLECPLWGVPVTSSIMGAGIVTAPAAAPVPLPVNCDVPVATGVPITVSVKHAAGIAAVTSNLVVIGVFEG